MKTQSQRDAFGNGKSNIEYWYHGTGRLGNYILYGGGDPIDYRYTYNSGDATRVDSINALKGGINAIAFNNYDQNGFITQVTTSGTANAANARTLTNDVRGRVLKKVQDGHKTYSLIANEEAIGSSSDGAAPVVDTFRSSYVPISSEALAAGPSAYTVQAGETLQSIAKSVWGNANLWYLLADANGKTTVATGEVITIPGKQNTVLNNAQTFAPYNAGQALGNETPIPAPPKKKSNWLKQLVVIIVMIVATVFTAGALTAGLSASFGSIMSAGATVLASGAAGIGVAAASAAVGSVVSQTVGILVGAQDSFSWKGVALAAISGGVAGGLAGVDLGFGAGNLIARAAIGNAISQGIGVVTGLQKSFDWRGVAASAVGAGVGQVVGGALGMNDAGFKNLGFGQQFGARLMTGLAAGTAAAVMRGGRIAVQQIATDAFGNALGQGMGDQANPRANNSKLSEPQWQDLFDRTGYTEPTPTPGVIVAAVSGYSMDGGKQVLPPWSKKSEGWWERSFIDGNGVVNVVARKSPLDDEVPSPVQGNDASWAPGPYIPPPPGVGIDRAQRAASSMNPNTQFVQQLRNNPGDANVVQRAWNSRANQSLMGATALGTALNAAVGAIGDTLGGWRGYNPVANQYYGPDEQRNAMWRAVGLATASMGIGGPSVLQEGRAVWVQSSEIRQTQQSISYAKRDAQGNIKYTLDDIAEGLRNNPTDRRLTIDAVRMRDGKLASVDNFRPAVLNAQGGGEIRARIREIDEQLTQEEMRRFTASRNGETRVPTTWGEAAEFRIWKQGEEFTNRYPNGATVTPKITGAPAGSIWEQYNQFPWLR